MIPLESRGHFVSSPRCEGKRQNEANGDDDDEGKSRHDLVVSPQVDPNDVAEVTGPVQPVGHQGDASRRFRAAYEAPAIDVPKSLPGVDQSPDGEGPAVRRDVEEVLV